MLRLMMVTVSLPIVKAITAVGCNVITGVNAVDVRMEVP